MNERAKAGTGARFVAALIDGVLAAIVSSIIPVLGAILSTGYMLIKDGLFEGQSLGKKVMNLQVVSENGTKADYNVSIKRNIIFAIPTIIMIIPILGWIVAPLIALAVGIMEVFLVLTDPAGRRFGDKFGKSQVVAMNESEANKANQ